MPKIKVPQHVRSVLVERVESAIAAVIAEFEQDMSVCLAVSPWPETPEGERAAWLLRREAQKAIQQKRMRQDGPRKRLRRCAVGTPCPKSGAVMASTEEVELDHDEYDGRPPVAVHRGWHRKAQPH